jgi:hypothetical protein
VFNSPVIIDNRVLKIFGPKREALTGGWRKLHNELKVKLSL